MDSNMPRRVRAVFTTAGHSRNQFGVDGDPAGIARFTVNLLEQYAGCRGSKLIDGLPNDRQGGPQSAGQRKLIETTAMRRL
jgi:hypothetical protein